MTIAVDWDVKNQTKLLNLSAQFKLILSLFYDIATVDQISLRYVHANPILAYFVDYTIITAYTKS